MKALRWELTGAGLESFGRDGRASYYVVEPPGEGELLARVDACGICFSDIKILNLGGEHPRLRGRDLARQPIVMGHEVALTVEAVGPGVTAPFAPGDRAIVQADVYYKGQGMAMGYRLPGGFSQYVRIGREILEGDEGCYLIPVSSRLGYAEAALCEPWACVEASYRYRPRETLKPGGALLVFCAGLAPSAVQWPDGPERPGRVTLLAAEDGFGLPEAWPPADLVRSAEAPAFLASAREAGVFFDDILVLGAPTAAQVEALLPLVAKSGILCLIGAAPADPVAVDVGRVHYEDVGILGSRTPDVANAYAWQRSAEIGAEVAWFIGAGGPMGQMHLQRALSSGQAHRRIIATQNTGPRLEDLRQRFGELAARRGTDFLLLNPKEMAREALQARLRQAAACNGGRFQDIVCLVPSVETLEWASSLLGARGGLNIFAGLPVGTIARMDLRPVVEYEARFWGTSGSSIADLRAVAEKLTQERLDTASVVAAVAGIHGVREGLAAVRDGRYLGKTVIYPHLENLPLLSVAEVAARYPGVGEKLTGGRYWNREAEAELFRCA
jgi:threonine dehydrogenase-like Zn-dependent dehydrogenase